MIKKIIRKTSKAAARLRNRSLATTVILLYHRVTDLQSDPQLLAVSPANFSEHLALLRARYHVISLMELASSLRNSTVPNRGVVITFDDGYADNFDFAKPLLDRHGLPATVFVSSGSLDSKNEFWWDELERIFLTPGDLPEALDIEIAGKKTSHNFGEHAHYKEGDQRKYQDWNVQSKGDPTPRHTAYRSLMKALYLLPSKEREDIIRKLQQWAERGSEGRATHLPLKSDEVRFLAKGGVEVGAHTHSHSRLSSLNVPEQRAEIFSSRQFLEETLRMPVKSFSYPFGSADTYTRETVDAVRDAGFTASCSNFPGGVRQDADLYQLPRFLVRNWPASEFEKRLKDMFVE